MTGGRRVAGLALWLGLAGLVAASAQEAPEFVEARRDMVEHQLKERGISDSRVLAAMGEVPRQLFVPEEHQPQAYADDSLSIGSSGQTIHQPYLVAQMTSLLELDRGAKVLEIGTGSGYHSAVLSKLARQVFTIEIDPAVGKLAQRNLKAAGCKNVHAKIGDGYLGWPEEAPFDSIILTTAPPRVPQPLIDQLRVGGIMVLPEGDTIQNLLVITKSEDGYERRVVKPVSLPRMKGEAERKPPTP
ncbi:MAG TPA: protein-L-isoaspartate(D-aspartate) O-methyltransferase [Thermoanaerobaculia bacterium]|nr:protein-L-isoaspartate(D-aspartate) O-methyltransferase [Thermoanaerobaculia bacterium]